MYPSNGPPARLARSTASKGNGFWSNGSKLFREDAGVARKRVTEFSLVHAVTRENWTLASIDEGVRKGLVELVYKAGRPYLRIV
jgi:hypothetical protein